MEQSTGWVILFFCNMNTLNLEFDVEYINSIDIESRLLVDDLPVFELLFSGN